ncbi:P-loop containing nucleoside triphosphate hydrolase protein [Kalaharituber pfeilii]|nr:P-loop containing nucleoside triphosphate hydrolase protein [Kalaharituber pfeilii]
MNVDDFDQADLSKLKHSPGAIVRVKLHNFVTYTDVEFNPGPSLNMVIGPNGTGKSTLVCAICLGLGWGPNHLGRAKEVGAYVKHGCKEATIEIELQRKPKAEMNPVVKRIIYENNSTKFYLNGKPVTQTAISNLMKEFSIQIDNLCQFLPQDRVAEFAALDPVSLLKETQRAAAPPHVREWHKKLIEMGKAQKDLKILFDADNAQLQNLESRQRALQPDVARLRERQGVLREIELHKRAKPYARYRISREVWRTAKSTHRGLAAELEKCKTEQEPALKQMEEKENYKMGISEALKKKKKTVEEKDRYLQEFKRKKLDEPEGKIKDKRAELSAAVKKEKERKARNDEMRLKQSIQKLKEAYQDKPLDVDVQGYNAQLREKNREIAELGRKKDDIRAEVEPRTREIQQKAQLIAQLRTEINQLQSLDGQRENLLKSFSNDTYRAYMWIKENQNKFQKEVYGPPIVNCTVTDPRYADILEGIIGRGNALAITCQTESDYKLLSNTFFGSRNTQGMGLAEVTILSYAGASGATLAEQQSPCSSEELRQRFKMDGWALDFIEGPDAVLNMLCNEARLHTTPVTLRNLNSEENKNMESNFASWVTSRTIFQVRWRREYGPDAKSISTRKIQPGNVFSAHKVDQSEKQRLEKRNEDLLGEIDALKREIEDARTRYEKIKLDLKELEDERTAIHAEKDRKMLAVRQWNALGTKIEQEESRLAQKMKGNFREEAARLEAELTTLSMQRAKAALQFTTLVKNFFKLQDELLQLQIWELEAASDVDYLKARNQQVRDMLKTKSEEMERARIEAGRDHDVCKALIAKEDLSPEDNAYLDSITARNLTLEELDTEIDVIQGRLSLLHEGNPNAIREFEQREKEIEVLQKAIQEKLAKLDEFGKQIHEIREKWEPELDRVVRSISRAFSESFNKIGCAGEVRVHKVEEFDKWEIQILVKFREAESLQILTNQRQSGGERAVSTVFYLMALQSLAQAPFRVVDEINQGMDPRNERLVHHRMVGIACKKHTSQYFLITPKLLSGLTYHPRMKVHTINSGDWVEEGHKMDVAKYIARAKELKARGQLVV